jgi:hypothetical protein
MKLVLELEPNLDPVLEPELELELLKKKIGEKSRVHLQSAHLLTQVCSSTNFPSVFFSSFSFLGCLIVHLFALLQQTCGAFGADITIVKSVCCSSAKGQFLLSFKSSTTFILSYDEVINKIHTITKTITL